MLTFESLAYQIWGEEYAEIFAEYTKVGTFDATDDFIEAVENNPVLEGWGNKIILISQP